MGEIVPLVEDWARSFSDYNSRISGSARAVTQHESYVRDAVAPVISTGSQLSRIVESVTSQTAPIGKLWDLFTSGLTRYEPRIPAEMIDPSVRSQYEAVIREAAPDALEKTREIASRLDGKLSEEQAHDILSDYEESIVDARVASLCLYEAAKESLNIASQSSVRESWLASLFEAIGRIKEKIGQALGHLVTKLSDEAIEALGRFKDAVGGGLSAITTALSVLCRAMERLFLRVVSGMFDLARRIQTIAKARGFHMTEISLEVEGAGVDITSVVGIPVPIPRLTAPKLFVTFTP